MNRCDFCTDSHEICNTCRSPVCGACWAEHSASCDGPHDDCGHWGCAGEGRCLDDDYDAELASDRILEQQEMEEIDGGE